MDNQQAERLRALWKSGRDKYTSFFSVLEEVRAEIGDDALPRWCGENLQLGFSIIVKVRNLLRDTDAEIVKQNLAAAKAAVKAQAEEDKAQAAIDRERKKGEREQRLAEAKIEAEKQKAAAKAAVEKVKADLFEETKQKKPRQKRQRLAIADIPTADLIALADAYKAAEAMCQGAINQWIEGSVIKALTLFTARQEHRSDQGFGSWCETNRIEIHHGERAALIKLGGLGEVTLREILAVAESRSYRIIWEQNKPKPEFAVIEGG